MHVGLQPRSHRAAASVSWACSLNHIELQLRSHRVAASAAYGCSFGHKGLQPRLPMVQLRSHRVAASAAYGCRAAECLEERDEVRLLLPEDLAEG
eukprot:scaffold94641_cov51-Phaeocystis_antarctica.AAC.1